jgi:hypothetical protein
LLWTHASPRFKRWIDVFATLVLLLVVTVQTIMLFDKVANTYRDNVAERVNQLAEDTTSGERPAAKPKATPAQPDFDLGSAMDDMLASLGVDND